MQENWDKYLKMGIVHFMAYPATIKGEGPILETMEKIVKDEFFNVVELTWIKDDKVREEVKKMLNESKIDVAYGAQPILLVGKLDLNSLADEERNKAVSAVKKGIDEASFMGAKGVAVLSGPHPGDEKKDAAMDKLLDSLIQLSKYAGEKGLNFELEPFDFNIDKKCLIGTSEDAIKVAEKVKKECSNFGLLVDRSHLPLLNETNSHSLSTTADYLTHIHIGNCLMKDKQNPAYGDQHPRFGIEGGETGVDELKDFLQVLFKVGYLKEGKKPIVSFEVKPLAGEKSEDVVEDSKKVFKQAWEKL